MTDKTLGPGVRVFVKWLPPGAVSPEARYAIAWIGTIASGPFVMPPELAAIFAPGIYFEVHMDGGGAVVARDSALVPLDDGDDHDEEIEKIERLTDVVETS